MLRPDKGITETVQSKRNCHITVAVPFYMQVIWTGNACYYYPQRSLHRHENRHPPHADPAAAVPGMGDHLRGAIQHPRKSGTALWPMPISRNWSLPSCADMCGCPRQAARRRHPTRRMPDGGSRPIPQQAITARSHLMGRKACAHEDIVYGLFSEYLPLRPEPQGQIGLYVSQRSRRQ